MKKLTKNEVKTWIKNNKKKLIIGGSVVGGALMVGFGAKKLILDNDAVATELARLIMEYRVKRHNYTCSLVGAYTKHGITQEQAQAIIDEAVAKFEALYRAAGMLPPIGE